LIVALSQLLAEKRKTANQVKGRIRRARLDSDPDVCGTFPIQEDSLPYFQVQQTPDPALVVSSLLSVVGEKSLYHFRPEKSTI